MPRSEVSGGEEVTCTNTKFAAKLRKTTDRAVAYWQCHQRCGGKHTWCGACACCSFVELVATPRVAAYLPERDQCGGVS